METKGYKLTPEEAAAIDRALDRAPKAFGHESAEIGQVKRKPDGSVSFSLKIRQTLKDRLLQALFALYNSEQVTEQERAELKEQHAFLLETLMAVRRKREQGEYRLEFEPYPEAITEDPEKERVYFARLWAVLNSGHVNGLLGYLLPRRGRKREEQGPAAIKVSASYLQNRLNTGKKAGQLPLPFDAAKDDAAKTGITLQEGKEFREYGIQLTVAQHDAVNAVLSALHGTNYEGNTDKRPVRELLPAFSSDYGALPEEALLAFKNTGSNLPAVRITQREYLRLCGLEEDGSGNFPQSAKEEAIKALKFIAQEQFVYWWERTKKRTYYEEQGEGKSKRRIKRTGVERDANGKPIIEQVYAVGTMFYVKEITDPATQRLEYYEISPHPVMLDRLKDTQHTSMHYIYYPLRLEKEVQKRTGKRLKKIEAQLLLWLAWKYEEERRNRQALKRNGNEEALAKKGGEIPTVQVIDWKQLARELKEPESQLQKKQKTVYSRLQAAYDIAVAAGFLKGYERGPDGIDRLYYNPDAYRKPENTLPSGNE